MNAINDGGPAFPMEWSNNTGKNILVGDTVIPHGAMATVLGLTVRDYFAAKALIGLLACADGGDFEDQKLLRDDYPAYCLNLAESAYLMADAMLKARQP